MRFGLVEIQQPALAIDRERDKVDVALIVKPLPLVAHSGKLCNS
jgi:hypothetical protein